VTEEEIRYEYVIQLWDYLTSTDDRFMIELFNRGACEWVCCNVFRFWCPKWFVIDKRLLEVMQLPNVVWVIPSIGVDKNNLYVDVTVLD